MGGARARNRSGAESLYGVFGEKRGLFLAVVEHYFQRVLEPGFAVLDAPGSALANLEQVFGAWGATAVAPEFAAPAHDRARRHTAAWSGTPCPSSAAGRRPANEQQLGKALGTRLSLQTHANHRERLKDSAYFYSTNIDAGPGDSRGPWIWSSGGDWVAGTLIGIMFDWCGFLGDDRCVYTGSRRIDGVYWSSIKAWS